MENNERLICVIIDFMTDERAETIRKAAEANGFKAEFYKDIESAGERLGQCEVLYCYNAEIASHAKNAKWVSSTWAGVAPFLEPGVLQEGCILTNGAGSYGLAISEHVIGVALMLLKRLPEYFESLERGEWIHNLEIRSIYGSSVTIIGTGDIGQNIATRMKALGAESVHGVNYRGKNPDNIFDDIRTFDKVDEILPATDILVLCAPDTPDTAGMMNADRIGLLSPHSIIVNVGRGTIMDQDALVEALNSKKIQGAALDVMVPEPLPMDHPLRSARNCIITPHIAGNMTLKYTCDKSVENFCKNLARYTAGEPMEHTVNFEKGY